MRLKKYNKSIGMLSLIAATVLLSGCDMVLMNPKGAIGVEQRTLIITAIALMLIVVVPVIFMAFAFARKYRASNKDAKYSPNWAHSTRSKRSSGPFLSLSSPSLAPLPEDHPRTRPVQADCHRQEADDDRSGVARLEMAVHLPEQGIATVNELAFPKDVPVEFKITSNSVMNSFFIPQLGGQIYAMAGMQTKLHLIGNEAGAYKGISSSYSGAGFSGMKFTAIVTPTEGDFDQWVAKVKASSKT